MGALTAAYPRQSRGVGYVIEVPLNVLSVVYKGGLGVKDTDGYGRPGVDTASFVTAGIALESKTGGASDGDVSVRVRFGLEYLFTATSITQDMLFTPMYLVNDNEVDDAAGATNDVFVGIMTEFVSTTSCWVFVPGPVAYPTSGVTASVAEINVLDGPVAGAASASKAVVLGTANEISGIRRKVNLAAATQTLTAAMSGEKFVGAVDAVFTLPAAAAGTKGVWYEFECGAVSAGTGLSISPNASDHIRGNGLTSTDDKDLINSGATDRLGDSVRLYCDGAEGWVIEEIIGTWAKE